MAAIRSHSLALTVAGILALVGAPTGVLPAAHAGPPAGAKQDYPPFEAVVEGMEKVVSTSDGSAGMYDLYKDEDSGKLLAVLPSNYDNKLTMIACTVSGGDPEAGVMGPTYYVKWRKINKQLVLVAPDLSVRTSGSPEAKDSIKSLYTDRVLVATPILSMAPGNRPVIDLSSLAVAQAGKFFGPSIFGQYGANMMGLNPGLATLTKAKAFPKNVICEFEAPKMDGRLVRLTYSFGALEGTPGFKSRKADPRVGYFYDWHQDYAQKANRDITDRYISRWNVEKRDPNLKLSPPKQPIVWYIEHTTPVEYRRYVKQGILLWNKAFEEIGIVGALEVRQQDASTGTFMDIDPEDARYNFFRWNASNQGYAIGPSRTNPETGEILDADVVWHQGLTRSVRGMLENLSDDLVAQTFSPDTLAWFDEHPSWDPRIRLAGTTRQEQAKLRHTLDSQKAATEELTSEAHPWSHGLNDPTNTACRIGNMLSVDLALANTAAMVGMLGDPEGATLDGMPEEFLGPMIRYISAHEVGHCLGLQHNMAASSIRTLEEINTPGYEGPTIGSVMDYCAANINHELGEVQGPYATPEVGPYDMWAIAFGYGPESDRDKVLSRVSEPDHIYVSQLAMMSGSDPRNMTWDLGADNLNYCVSRISLSQDLRARLVDDVIKEGQSWKTARDRLGPLLGTQVQSLAIASNWIGGSYINNDFKGDPGNRTPIEDVAPDDQRRALNLIIENSFYDDAYGLTPELVRHLGREYWWDPAEMNNLFDDPSFDVHNVVDGIQATALTLVLNPGTLRRVYDNEYRTQGADDTFTLNEVMTTVSDAAWSECISARRNWASDGDHMVSSFRRNLQREHLSRLIDLALLPDTSSPSVRTISSLARQELRRIDESIAKAQKASPDTYSAAHFADAREQIERALDAAYVIAR